MDNLKYHSTKKTYKRDHAYFYQKFVLHESCTQNIHNDIKLRDFPNFFLSDSIHTFSFPPPRKTFRQHPKSPEPREIKTSTLNPLII